MMQPPDFVTEVPIAYTEGLNFNCTDAVLVPTTGQIGTINITKVLILDKPSDRRLFGAHIGMKGNIHMSDVVLLLQQQTKFNANKEELEVNFAVEAPEGGVVGASTITEPPSGDKIKALDSGEGELV